MKILGHVTAPASYYDSRAASYDQFNEKASAATNEVVERILKDHNVLTVLDLTCGTGSQVFWLTARGFKVVGSDISAEMLTVARKKAKASNLEIEFFEGDCRGVIVGTFDAAITIFNAIGHLTREDFKVTVQNIGRNLKPGGLYIFDIFNLDYLTHGNNITKLTGDWMTFVEGRGVREIQFSTISDEGVLVSYSTYVHQEENLTPTKIVTGYENTLQVYGVSELVSLLKECGFEVVSQTGMDGQEPAGTETERVLTVARKM